MKRLLLAATFLLSASLASAQTVLQSGTVTAGHAARWVTNNVIGDAGTAANGSLTSLGVTNNGGPGICVNSGVVTGAYNQICLSASTTGGGQITLNNVGGATGGFSFVLNGTTQGFPLVTGLPVTTGDLVCFNDTAGTLKDCGAGPSGLTVTNHAVAVGTGSLGFTPIGPATTGLFLASTGVTTDPAFRAWAGTDCVNPSAVTFGCVFSLPAGTGTVISGIGNDGTPTRASTIVLTASSTAIVAVGRQGASQPAFIVNSAVANSITGVSVTANSTTNGVDIAAVGETTVPLRINAAGSGGTISLNSLSGGSVNSYGDLFVLKTSPTMTFGISGNTTGIMVSTGSGGFQYKNDSGDTIQQVTPNAASGITAFFRFIPTSATPFMKADGASADISFQMTSKGNASLIFATGAGGGTAAGTNQVLVTHTAATTALLTLTGSNGGNPTISATSNFVGFGVGIALPAGSLASVTCNAAATNVRRMITDSSSATPTFGANAASGGGNTVPVFCDGTNWRNG